MIRSKLAAATLIALAAYVIPAAAQTRTVVGVLRCQGAESVNYIFVAEHWMQCTFRGLRGQRERYVGVIQRYGVDFAIDERSVLVWNVLAPTRAIGPGALAGSYGGVSAGAAFGVGLAANVLLGGSNQTMALQPLSLEGQTGVNIMATITRLRLTPS